MKNEITKPVFTETSSLEQSQQAYVITEEHTTSKIADFSVDSSDEEEFSIIRSIN